MDPVANIKRQLELAVLITELGNKLANIRGSIVGGGSPGELAVFGAELLDLETQLEKAGEELAELVITLDEWRRDGGFDPYHDHVSLPSTDEQRRSPLPTYTEGKLS